MVHDMRPAVMNAIRSGINRRGALAALFAAVPFASLNLERPNAVAAQGRRKRAKTEGKKKEKSSRGPAGPAGAQGPAGLPGTPRTITIVTRTGSAIVGGT